MDFSCSRGSDLSLRVALTPDRSAGGRFRGNQPESETTALVQSTLTHDHHGLWNPLESDGVERLLVRSARVL